MKPSGEPKVQTGIDQPSKTVSKLVWERNRVSPITLGPNAVGV